MNRRRATKLPLLGLCVTLSGLFNAIAQPIPKITSLSANWIQRGTTAEIVFEGENLSRVTRFIFSGDAGLSATNSTGETPVVTLVSSRGGISTGDDEDKMLRTKVTATPDAPLGAREVRVVTSTGVSNPLSFTVGYLPEVAEKEPNNSTNDAQLVELPAAINGKIHEASEVDYFRFKAQKDQRLIFDVYATRIGSPLDSSLALLDAAGKELVRSEDVNAFDSLIDFTIPEDGEYILQLRDFRYQGGKDYKYRIHAGAIPYLDGIFPFGARRGQSVEVTLRGRNLDDVSKIKLKVDANAPLGTQEIRAHAPKGYSNSRPFEVGDLAEFMEQEPNNLTNKANSITLPVVVNGRISGEKDVDVFKFKVEKDRQYIFEVEASRFGSPLDALLTLTDAKGTVLQRNDDAAGADARIDQKFSEAGEYFLSIRDLLERNGDEFGYRVSIRVPAPNFAVKFLSDNLRVSRGSHVTVRAEITRQAGFAGPVEVAFASLPAGLSSMPVLIPPDLSSGILTISAAEDTALGHFAVKLSGSSAIGGRQVTRDAQPLVNDRPAKEAFLTVLDSPPFTLEMVTLGAVLEQDQSASVEVLARRRNGFAGDIKLTAEGFSTGRDAITKNVDVQPVTLKAGESRGTLNLKAKLDSDLGSRAMFIKGEATVDGQTSVQHSRTIPLTVNQLPFSLANTLKKLSLTVQPPGGKSAAGEAEFTVKTTRRGWFTDQIALSIEGLPEGVVATSTNFPVGVSEAAFKLTATDKAPVGKEISITILGSATIAGRNYQQRTSPITLTVNAAADVGGDEKVAVKKDAP